MVDITVDAKPMPQNRVDPDVKIPDSIQRRSAAVDAMYAQPAPPPPQAPSATTPSAPAPRPTASENLSPPEPPQPSAADPNQLQLPIESTAPPPAPAPSVDYLDLDWRPDGPIENGSLENRVLALQGRLKAERRLN